MAISKVLFDTLFAKAKTGQVVMKLFAGVAPKTTENFRCFCTGKKSIGGAGKSLNQKGNEVCKGEKSADKGEKSIKGDNGTGGVSVKGEKSADKKLKKQYPRPSVLSMVSTRPKPKRPKFGKQHRGKMKGISCKDHIHFGTYALQACESAWITAKQVEAGRKVIARYARRGGKIWVRIFPNKPITAKPTETRMGRGKGSFEYMVSVVKPGQILYEMGGISEKVARAAIEIASCKMPIRTQFVTSG